MILSCMSVNEMTVKQLWEALKKKKEKKLRNTGKLMESEKKKSNSKLIPITRSLIP